MKATSLSEFFIHLIIFNLVEYWSDGHSPYLTPLTNVEFGPTFHSEEYKCHFRIQYGGADLVPGNIKAKIVSPCLKNAL